MSLSEVTFLFILLGILYVITSIVIVLVVGNIIHRCTSTQLTLHCCVPGLLTVGKSEAREETKGPVLRSALHGRCSLSKHTSEEGDGQPQAKKKKIDLIFKDVLEASLEASKSQENPLNSTFSMRRTRAQRVTLTSQRGESYLAQEECKVTGLGLHPSEHLEGGFNVRCLKMEDSEDDPGQIHEEPSTSFCPNCVKLKRRIRELEAEVIRLRGGNQVEVPPHPELAPIDELQGRSQRETEQCGEGYLVRLFLCFVAQNFRCDIFFTFNIHLQLRFEFPISQSSSLSVEKHVLLFWLD